MTRDELYALLDLDPLKPALPTTDEALAGVRAEFAKFEQSGVSEREAMRQFVARLNAAIRLVRGVEVLMRVYGQRPS